MCYISCVFFLGEGAGSGGVMRGLWLFFSGGLKDRGLGLYEELFLGGVSCLDLHCMVCTVRSMEALGEGLFCMSMIYLPFGGVQFMICL